MTVLSILLPILLILLGAVGLVVFGGLVALVVFLVIRNKKKKENK